MVYGIIQRHKGDLEIESAPGKGTVVRLKLSAALSAASKTTTDVAGPLPQLCLLIVDDDPILLRSLRDVLEADGHVITAVGGGEAGLLAFGEAQRNQKMFDAVITDLGMPGVDGRRVATGIKQSSPSTPVIMLTGWGERLRAEEDLPAHVDYVLSKPPKLAELRAALNYCCTEAFSLKTA
jgi:CheY-like chemotaxis protein